MNDLESQRVELGEMRSIEDITDEEILGEDEDIFGEDGEEEEIQGNPDEELRKLERELNAGK